MKILITSALPYVNNVPHLGNIIGCVLSADAFARYCRLRKHDVLYVCGTDEYGTATEIKALEEGKTPQEIVDYYFEIHKKIYDWFNISFDVFGRTTNPLHNDITQHIFLELYKNEYIIEKEVEQFYDEASNMFLADRYIEGICPYCEYGDARGDQCDKCGKLLTPEELVEPRSKLSGATLVKKKTKHLFLDLPKFEHKLKEWVTVQSEEGFWTESAKKVPLWWIKEGLKPRAITRDLKWGIPVPLPEFEGKVFYVWFDAPIGYISITATYTEKWKSEWWQNGEVKLYQFMGKDNIPFHTLLFPAMLMGTGEPWILPFHINTTEYLNYEGGKFSKSRGIGVFGDGAIDSGIPADVWRYYLFANRPEKADSQFTWDDFYDKTNSELIGNLANLVNRVLVFVKRSFKGEIPKISSLTDVDKEHVAIQKDLISEITTSFEKVRLKDALHKVMLYSKNANKYFQESKPWELIKQNPDHANTVINLLVHDVRNLAILSQPFLPDFSKQVLEQLNLESVCWDDLSKEISGSIGEPKPIFKKLKKEQIDLLRKRFSSKKSEEKQSDVSLEDFDIEVGKIIEIERHPNADRLYVEKVKLSDGVRQIVSGLVKYYTKEELLGKNVLILKNLKPAKLRGVLSEGMLLAAEDSKTVEVIFVDLPEGTKISQSGHLVTIDDFDGLDLKIKDCLLVYKDEPIVVDGKEIKTKKVCNGKVR